MLFRSMQHRSVSLNQVFSEIERQTGYSFLVRNNDINTNQKISIDVKNKSVKEVLEILFAGKNIRYEVEGERISVYKPQQTRQTTISGIVVDAAQEPIIGASVVVVNTTNGCITDFDGKFSLEVSQLPVKVQISREPRMPTGISRFGFFVSSAAVLTASKPRKAKNTIAAPRNTPENPNSPKVPVLAGI